MASLKSFLDVYYAYSGGAGGGATNLDGLTDVVITSPSSTQVLKYNGTNWVNDTDAGGGGGLTYVSTSTNVTASANTGYIVNTTSGAVTITLPASPTIGQQVGIVDGAGTAATNAITINPNGGKIQGSTGNMTVNTARAAFTLVYFDSAQGWLLTNV